MKILYFTNVPSPYRIEFFNMLSKTVDVTVLFYDDKNEKHRNPLWYKKNVYNFRVINLKKFALFQLNKLLNSENYDVVIIGTYASINGAILNILLRMKKIKFFLNADGGFIPSKESILSKTLKKTFISSANYFLSTGKTTDKYLTFYGANPKEISFYHFSSLNKKDILEKPINYQTKLKMRIEKGFSYKRLFISVGSFIYTKGYDIFLDSIRNLKNDDVGFIIIGGGKEKENYEQFLKKHNISNVHFIDFCEKEELFNYYKMSDVFFFSSRGDVWGLVINEAMACGLPIISSDRTNAAIELLKKNNLYSFDNSNALKKQINKYINKSNDELYDEGLKNLEKIKKYTIENMVLEHLEIFKKIK